MRYFFSLLLLAGFAPQLANAHFGHLGALAGHSHWVAGVAVAVAAAVLWGRIKAKANQDDDDAEAPETEGEEANV